MAAKKPISISRHKISDQKWETTFPKEFFLEIWLIIEDYTTEIKFGKKLFGCAFMGKTNFEQRPKNANLCLLAELAHGQSTLINYSSSNCAQS